MHDDPTTSSSCLNKSKNSPTFAKWEKFARNENILIFFLIDNKTSTCALLSSLTWPQPENLNNIVSYFAVPILMFASSSSFLFQTVFLERATVDFPSFVIVNWWINIGKIVAMVINVEIESSKIFAACVN